MIVSPKLLVSGPAKALLPSDQISQYLYRHFPMQDQRYSFYVRALRNALAPLIPLTDYSFYGIL